jgi:hypothetical protein
MLSFMTIMSGICITGDKMDLLLEPVSCGDLISAKVGEVLVLHQLLNTTFLLRTDLLKFSKKLVSVKCR